ncbi:Tyrosinase ustQ [Colletotrichum aenigma]|uniref:Tyrosinase ustQ n=1 Tax=Colletotrichum aenigma TaxID=1215731 RepID=UPI00187295AD|nr:Tyrosinase ustQ [Colletotrichum aenigma]KAF5520352.1 Tyrosinase ustQ [Colletotrichum aenigma]
MASKLSQIYSNGWNYELISDDHDASSEDLNERSSGYWDWTMDWMDLAASSIWNNETGFGGERVLL